MLTQPQKWSSLNLEKYEKLPYLIVKQVILLTSCTSTDALVAEGQPSILGSVSFSYTNHSRSHSALGLSHADNLVKREGGSGCPVRGWSVAMLAFGRIHWSGIFWAVRVNVLLFFSRQLKNF